MAFGEQHVDLSLQSARPRHERSKRVELFQGGQPLLPRNKQPCLQHADRGIRLLGTFHQASDRLLGVGESVCQQLDVGQRQQQRRVFGQSCERFLERGESLLRLALPSGHFSQPECTIRQLWKQFQRLASQPGGLVEPAVGQGQGEAGGQHVAVVGGQCRGAVDFLSSAAWIAVPHVPPRLCQPGPLVLGGGIPQLFDDPLCGLRIIPFLGEDRRQEQRGLRDKPPGLPRGVERLPSRIKTCQTGG